jgi:uncharacterized membrane protein
MSQTPVPPPPQEQPAYPSGPPQYSNPLQAPPRQSNGLAVAALVLGIVGAVFGLIPLTFFIAFICGVLAVIFGFVGLGKARRGAEHKGMAIAGLVLGFVALVLGIVGVVIVNDTANEIDKILNSP